MPADRSGAPWPGATYNGFSGPGAPPPEPRRSRGPSRGVVIGALAAAAIGLGLAAGFAFRPDRRALTGAESTAQPPAAADRSVPIELTEPPPPQAVPNPAGKLEVLNPAAAEAARPAATQSAASPPRSPDLSAEVPAPSDDQTGSDVAEAAPPPLVVAPSPRTPPTVRDVCAGARSRAEAMVCADPDLAAYDRELDRAYRRALRSGAVSPEDLRADQRDWLDDRERAARRSPRDMADLYEQRIDELNRIADDGPS